MKSFNLSIIIVLVIIFGGFIFFKDGFTQAASKLPTTPEVLMDRMNYLDYSNQNLIQAKKNGKTVLFFAATTWCTTCSALDEEIKKRSNQLPSNITILKVDYDQDKPMRNQYAVTTQHTLVVLDQNGNELKRWIGGNFDALLQEVKET